MLPLLSLVVLSLLASHSLILSPGFSFHSVCAFLKTTPAVQQLSHLRCIECLPVYCMLVHCRWIAGLLKQLMDVNFMGSAAVAQVRPCHPRLLPLHLQNAEPTHQARYCSDNLYGSVLSRFSAPINHHMSTSRSESAAFLLALFSQAVSVHTFFRCLTLLCLFPSQLPGVFLRT